MAFVQTVLGPIDAAELGQTLMHEHILFSYPGDELDPTGTWTRADALAVATERMEQLKENGADLARTMIGHQDQAEKAQQLIDIAARGSFVAVDRIGLEILSPDDHRVEMIKAVLDAGAGDRLCLSQDHICSLRSPRFPFKIPAHLQSVAEQLLPLVL